MNMKRMRGRNQRHGGGGTHFRQGGGGGGQPMNRNHVFDSIGPDMRMRGTAQQLFEKYLQLGRDATSGGDRVLAEGYFQHAEHYFRILNAMAQAQGPQQHGGPPNGSQGGYPQRRYQNGPEQPDASDGYGEQPELTVQMNGQANGHAPEPDGEPEAPPQAREPA